MKKTIFLLIGVLTLAYSAFAQFTSDNIAVYRYGDGSSLVNGGRVPVFIDEYNPVTGEKVRTISVSRTASGANYGIEGLGLTGGGAYENEGFPVLSRDGETLSIIGYNPTQSGQFVVGTINPAGDVSATTLVVDDIGTPRSAVVNGTAVYFNGYQNGVRYKTLGTTTASTRVSVGQNAPRVLTIAETILNNVTANKIFAPNATAELPSSNLPTASVTFATAPNFPGSARPVGVHQAVAIAAYGRTLIYLIDDNAGAPKIRKYRSNGGGSDWLALGSIDVPVTTKSLTAKFDGTGVRLYFITLGTPGNQNSNLYTIKDDFTDANDDIKNLSGAPVTIATATVNTSFRGVTLVPGSLKAPSSLSAAIISSNEVALSWTDNSLTETGFEVERSIDGLNYLPLATVAQNITNYTDNTVAIATSYYYRVRAIEGSGHSIYLNPASVTTGSGMITGINFSEPIIYENQPVGTVTGEFSVLPAGMQDITYTLAAGTDDSDNAKFEIVGDQLQNKVILDFETKQQYQIRVKATSPSNFSYEETFQITIRDVNEAPTIAAVGEQNSCVGMEEKTIAISGITAGPESGQIITANISSDNPQLFESLSLNLLAGGNGEITYRLNSANAGSVNISLVINDNGGTANGGIDTYSETFKLNINEFPTATITSDKGTEVDKGILVKLTANGGATYQWENAEGIIGATNTAELTVRPVQTTTYRVTAINAGGCSSTQEITIVVKDNYDLVVAGNLLSPNGDGLNDVWKIENIDLYPNNEVKVFDKSGRIIFSKQGYNNDWDGRIAGSSLNEDTYFYLIDFGPGLPKKKGFITMLNN